MKAGSAEHGFMRVSPLAVGLAVSVMIVSLIAFGAVTGMLPRALTQKQNDQKRNDLSRKQADADARPADPAPRSMAPSTCALCGTIESIRTIQVRDETGGAGAAGGRSSSAAVENQTGGGNGGTATTILRTVGSAFSSGTELEGKVRNAYRVTVRMDDGSFRTISLSSPSAFTVGEKVRVVEGKLVRA